MQGHSIASQLFNNAYWACLEPGLSAMADPMLTAFSPLDGSEVDLSTSTYVDEVSKAAVLDCRGESIAVQLKDQDRILEASCRRISVHMNHDKAES
eukprot:8542586-Pyramimonas_sp.AAC.1